MKAFLQLFVPVIDTFTDNLAAAFSSVIQYLLFSIHSLRIEAPFSPALMVNLSPRDET